MDQLLAALGLDEGAGEADALAALRSLHETQTAICAAAGLPEDSDGAALIAAVQSAFDTGAPDPIQYVPIDQVTALQNDLAALQASLAADKAEALVTAAISGGKLAPALKDWGLQLATADPDIRDAETGDLVKQDDADPSRIKSGTESAQKPKSPGPKTKD